MSDLFYDKGACCEGDRWVPIYREYASSKKEVQDYVDGRIRDFVKELSDDLFSIAASLGCKHDD